MSNNHAPMIRSFLQAAVTEEVAQPLRVVQIEGLAVLKIIKHCKESSPALVTGQLIGLDVGSVLEVTNCFPFPIREEDEEIEADGANYQLEMMRCLREVNVDNNTVGWYQSTLLGSFQTFDNLSLCLLIVFFCRNCSNFTMVLYQFQLRLPSPTFSLLVSFSALNLFSSSALDWVNNTYCYSFLYILV
ncbi:hypothetical protein MKW94_029264 [Papaver nudicaule]|uniref:MPN domain-containing protein n=1 Tax=Papaver nudicaule TaxID=74823 RepID=A0AA41V297_PAPNU|nr:hypothetical protein [Papaver nudicaule]